MDAVRDDPSSIAALLRARYKRRLPSSLNELTGPEHGMVALPLHIAWSGLRTLDLDLPRQRIIATDPEYGFQSAAYLTTHS